ncbi:DNA alkylation repair protein [Candidatus Kaiserbacteria bacterium]|nr:DNA alkylation repair protein [Candidatus Kaiserbacteria bacterium]
MNSEHKNLLGKIKNHRGQGTAHTSNDSYILSGHLYYDVSVPIRRQIAKDWLRENKSISQKDFVAVLDSLYQGESHEEKTLASYLLGYSQSHRSNVKPEKLNQWLNHLVGWAEVDSLSQNIFTAEEILGNWPAWQNLLEKLSRDKNINKRRASLALLTGPTHRSNDKRLSDLSFKIIDSLKSEKEIIITKAISWLLREMSHQHKKSVSDYLKENEESLPKIAVRETWQKIKTGKK